MRVKMMLAVLLVSSMLLSPLNTGIVNAQAEDAETAAEQVDSNRSSDRSSDVAERKAQRQSELDASIDQARTDRVAGRCVAAQPALAGAISRAETVEINRLERYGNVSTKLQNISARLVVSEVDVTVLDAQIAVFEGLVTEFFSDFNAYQLALQDAADIDCEADTEAFILALDDAKAFREELKEGSAAASSQLKDTITDTLNRIKNSLDTNESDEEQQ